MANDPHNLGGDSTRHSLGVMRRRVSVRAADGCARSSDGYANPAADGYAHAHSPYRDGDAPSPYCDANPAADGYADPRCRRLRPRPFPLPATATPVPPTPTPTASASLDAIELDGDSTWQEVFDALSDAERDCIGAAYSEARLRSELSAFRDSRRVG